MNKLAKIFLAILASFSLITLCTAPTYAADDACNPEVPEAIRQAAGCDGASPATSVQDVITNIIRGVIAVLGLVAVIFIVKGGIDYITSNGEAAKIQKAKSTILYATIGLVVSALAFVIVNFAIGIINGNTSNNSSNTTDNNGTGNDGANNGSQQQSI